MTQIHTSRCFVETRDSAERSSAGRQLRPLFSFFTTLLALFSFFTTLLDKILKQYLDGDKEVVIPSKPFLDKHWKLTDDGSKHFWP